MNAIWTALAAAWFAAAAGPPAYREDLSGAPVGGKVVFLDDFEKDADRDGTPDKWWRRRGKLAWDDRVAHAGRRSIRIDGPGEWGRSYGQARTRAFDLAREHYFVVWTRGERVQPRSVWLTAYYWDSKTRRAAGPRVESARIAPASEWRKLAVRLPGLPGAAPTVWVGVSLVSRSQTGRVWFDDLQVVRPVAAGAKESRFTGGGAPTPRPPSGAPRRRGSRRGWSEASNPAAAQPGAAKVVTLRGRRAVRLENEWARVTVFPDAGARIAEYALKAIGANAFRPETGYEDWLRCDGRRRWPDLSRLRFKATLRTGAAAAEFSADAPPLAVTRTVELGPGSRLVISTRLTNRDSRPHRVALQTHPELQLADRTTSAAALVSRREGETLRLHASAWIRNPGRWAALYDRTSGVFLAKVYPQPFAGVHVYWSDFFCTIEEITRLRTLKPGESFTFSVVYFLGRGCEPRDVSDAFALGLQTRPLGPSRLEAEARLFAFQPARVRLNLEVNGKAAGECAFQAAAMMLHRVRFDAPAPGSGESACVVSAAAQTADQAQRVRAVERLNPAALRVAAQLARARWEDWGSIRNLGYWYWFGRLWFFGGPKLKTLEDGYRVRVRDGGPQFGVGFRWPKPLEPGYAYRFELPFQGAPDFIAVDGTVVWRMGEGEWSRDGAAAFVYAPRGRGRGMIWCVRDVRLGVHGEKDAIGLPAALRRRLVARCRRAKLPAEGIPAAPDSWAAPANAWKTPCLQPDFDALYQTPARFDAPPLAQPPYPTDDVRVGALLRNLWRRPDIYPLLCRNGVDGAWVTERQDAGRPLPAETLAEIRRWIQRGKWRWFGSWMSSQHRWHLRPDWRKQLFPAGIRQANYATSAFPSLAFYFMIPETQSVYFGDAQPADDFERMRRIPPILRAWKERKIWPLLKHPDRCRAIYNTDHALFPVAYYYQGGADLAMVKNIHRQNVEIVGANARGAARAYGRAFALHYDSWNGIYRDSASPDELLHVLRLYYFYGADFIDHEGIPFFVVADGRAQPTAPGVSLLRAARFIRRHPRRGAPVVRVAVMRGFGAGAHPYSRDEIPCKSTGGGWSRPRPGVAEMQDFDLLRVLLPDYGVYWRTKLERFCTGTPYGQFDLIPWDTPAAHLRTFDLIVMMGRHGMDKGQWARLAAYVREGGTLVAALGQFRAPGREPRRFVDADLAEFPGVEVETRGGRPVEIDAAARFVLRFAGAERPGEARRRIAAAPARGAQVLARAADRGPIVLRIPRGRGQVFLFCTPYLTSVDEETAAWLLRRLAERVRGAEFRPASDWLEYVPRRKGRTYAFALFNHGRLRFPGGVGSDHGAWEGEMVLRLDRWPGLAGRLAAYAVDSETFALSPLPTQQTRGELRVRLRVDRFAEVVIGPAGDAKREFLE